MTDIQRYNAPRQPLMGDGRRADRALSRYQAEGQVSVAVVDVLTDAAIAKGDSVIAGTAQAIANVVRVAQALQQLELLAPGASGRLSMLADDHALGMAELVAALVRILLRAWAQAWLRGTADCRRLDQFAAQLSVEAQMDALTRATVQAIREAARAAQRTRG